MKIPILFKLATNAEELKRKIGNCTHVEEKDGKISAFFEKLKGTTKVSIPLNAISKGDCRYDGTVFGMYSGTRTDIPSSIVSVQ